jgi:tRNA(fMet)-specific endonuclease VapC
MKRYLLDTNTVSHLLKEHSAVSRRIVATPIAALCISAITEGELRFGLAKRPDAKRLHLAVKEFLRRVDVLSWDSAAAEHYGTMPAGIVGQGKVLSSLDGLIAAHALAVGAVLVSGDKAFGQVPGLLIEDWTS